MIDNEIIEKITKRGVKEIISETEFVNLLQSGKKLRKSTKLGLQLIKTGFLCSENRFIKRPTNVSYPILL